MTKQAWLARKEHNNGVVELELGRAPVNALSPQFLQDFADEMTALGDDDQVRAIVLSSPFKVFSAGLDLKEAQAFDLAQQNAIVRGLNVGFLAEFACPKPVVTAVTGAAIAGGLFFVLASDLRVAGPRASFGLAEVRVGADFPVGPLEIARATLDSNLQRRLMLTGQPIRVDEAHRVGMVDLVVDENDAVLSTALEQAQTMAQLPPQTFASIKRQLRGDTIAKIELVMANGGNAPVGGWFSDETLPAMQRMIG